MFLHFPWEWECCNLVSLTWVRMAPMQTSNGVDAPSSLVKPMPGFPANAKLSYLAEGGANVVYRINHPPTTVDTDREKPVDEEGGTCNYAGKLLRLRKNIESGTPYIETARNFDARIRRLFRCDELVDQKLVRMPKELIMSCNEQLKLDETSNCRSKARRGAYLSVKEPFGLLITDMTVAPGSGETLWEFKPKWLLQSPSAPPDATRCRTCALREMKNHDALKKAEKNPNGTRMSPPLQKVSFCPLDLVSDSFEDVLRATQFISNAPGSHRAATILYKHPTLMKLKHWQRHMNAVGLPGLEAQCQDRAVSMTLRDCTMYIKVSRDAPLT